MSADALDAKLDTIAAEIRPEDDLGGARMGWLVIPQSFLAYGSAHRSPESYQGK